MRAHALTFTAALGMTGLLVAMAPAPAINDAPLVTPAPLDEATMFDDESQMTDCLELAGPGVNEVSPDGITGMGERITLEVQVLIDTVESVAIHAIEDDEERAEAAAAHIAAIEEILAAGQESFEPMNVEVVFTQSALLPARSDEDRAATSAAQFIQLGKDFDGGVRPEGVDLVYVAHDVDTGSTVGLADCIGGVELDDRAFATGQLNSFDTTILVDLSTNTVPRTFAHELGHLLGAHHHYQSCGDATLQESSSDLGPCSLMTNFVNFQTYPASLTNRMVMRGHIEAWANS